MKNTISIFAMLSILVCVISSVRFDVVADELVIQNMGCMTDIECEAQDQNVRTDVKTYDCDDEDCSVTDNNESFQVLDGNKKRTMFAETTK